MIIFIQKLSDPSLGPKSYWTVLNKILNKKKYTNIPPLLINDIFVSNFQTKADLFNDFFVEQCSIYDNGSTLPARYIRPDQTLDFIDIDDHKILKAIRNLNPNKAHGCDDISIRMLKICDDSIVLPLRHTFTKCLEFQTFPTLWKRANILPIHKKQSRQLIKNYRPISLLPVCGKIFEKLIFDYIYEHLCNNRLITPNQSGFRPGDSNINQFLSITQNIYEGFEMEPSRETRAVF